MNDDEGWEREKGGGVKEPKAHPVSFKCCREDAWESEICHSKLPGMSEPQIPAP